MKSLSLNNRRIELIVYCLVWAMVFSLSFFNARESNSIDWNRLIAEWMHLIPFLIIFIINVYVLVPRFLFVKKYLYYLSLVVTIVVVIIGSDVLMQSSPQQGDGITIGRDSKSFASEGNTPLRKPPHMVFLDNFIIALLLVGAGTASKLVSKWLDEEKLRKDIEKEQLKTNLALLRHQVSPHFFMNTLNNIHALIDINSENAKDAIVRLSTLMRYLLYDSSQGSINLKKEIEFINSFVSLMRLRYSEKVDILVIVPEQIPDIKIPPMLFISFLENAFKHGISYQSKSFVHFKLEILEKYLHCTIKNSKYIQDLSHYNEYSGIGLVNIKESLKLLYNEDYKLIVSDKENEFEINLSIPL